MSPAAYSFIISALAGGAVLLVIQSLSALQQEVPQEEREYMDPLPPALKLLWPLVKFFAFHFGTRVSSDYLERVHRRLQETGAGFILTAEQYVATRIIATLVVLVVGTLTMLALDIFSGPFLIVLAFIGNYYPEIWLRDRRLVREKEILRTLPVFLDFITMSVEAGLNLTGAIKQAIEKGPTGALRNEFYMVTRDLRAGMPRADALRRMEARLNLKEITSFVGTVIQAEKMGASVGAALRIQSEQRRMERFQRAEKLAMEAPVKLIMPLIMFIFPVTFIVLAFPIVMKFIQEGML